VRPTLGSRLEGLAPTNICTANSCGRGPLARHAPTLRSFELRGGVLVPPSPPPALACRLYSCDRAGSARLPRRAHVRMALREGRMASREGRGEEGGGRQSAPHRGARQPEHCEQNSSCHRGELPPAGQLRPDGVEEEHERQRVRHQAVGERALRRNRASAPTRWCR
jgi:hypothetical protein